MARVGRGSAYIGTSGYSYEDWRGRFYPRELSQARWLEFYSQRFPTVELNVTFYRLPSEAAFRSWYQRTPPAFQIAVKGSRFITHVKRLKDVDEPVQLFFKRAGLLGEKLSVVLWQLPPSMRLDLKRLEGFVRLLIRRRTLRHALEVRHPGWLVPETRRLLEGSNIALCQTDWPDCPVEEPPAADFAYVRRHGTGGWLYGGRYPSAQLQRDAETISRWRQEGRDVFCYFNNDQHAYAAVNAGELIELVRSRRSGRNTSDTAESSARGPCP